MHKEVTNIWAITHCQKR